MLGSSLKVYLAPGATDLRKSINGLSVQAASELELDVLSGNLFVFCNRKRDLIKILYWDRNGFCLWMKRLERHKFQWPADFGKPVSIDRRSLNWLLDGLNPAQLDAHQTLNYKTVA